MPFKSKKQNAWAHTPAGTQALGGKAKVKEWESATDYSHLPEKKKKIKGGNTELSPASMKRQALTNDRQDNLAAKNEFVSRKRTSGNRSF